MMAHDSRSTPEPRTFSDDTAHRLRDAVAALWSARTQGGAPGPDAHAADALLAEALAGAVHDARERALRAEDVVIALKAMLEHLPDGDAPHRRFAAVRFREELVSRCIRAYYGQ